jgi:hypothetical protein
VVVLHWAVIIGLVLMIPILAIVLDSAVGQALANRIESFESLREETEFVRRLIEGSGDDEPSQLGPGD